ncbi:LLM class flavin-dependent oxidoreductase [Streptomyces phaeofaciens]|uniref:LLM class flavin-dependent oxidoreductase n=1 Tax=Streptomyces phaeofaciens TaxID=68254 RepID=UPI001E314D3B|nr:LLM class flavin-dependent oxidoreductase [Streptomyces phaeofaciens]
MISPRYQSTDELVKRVQLAERLGVDQVWLEQQPDQRDALVTASAYLHAAPSISVGTAVLPVYARHPVAMAQAAASLSELSSGRFVLGLGYSHKFVNEYVLGLQQGPPIGVMREYVDIVRRLTGTGEVNAEGRHFTAHAQYTDPPGHVPIYLAALRPQMIRLAVELGEGIVIWLSSLRYVREQVMPVVREACAEFGKDEKDFTVLTILPAYTGTDEAEQRSRWAKSAASYRMLPYYRHVLNAYGDPQPEEFSLIGPASRVRERLAEYREAGCVPVPSPMPGTDEDFISTVEAAYGSAS